MDGFQNSAINLEKSLAFSDEHIRHKKLRFAVPVGNTFFSRSIYSDVESKKTLYLGTPIAGFNLQVERFGADLITLEIENLH